MVYAKKFLTVAAFFAAFGPAAAQQGEFKVLDLGSLGVYAKNGNWCNFTVWLNLYADTPEIYLNSQRYLQSVVHTISGQCPKARTLQFRGFYKGQRVYRGAVGDLRKSKRLRDMSIARRLLKAPEQRRAARPTTPRRQVGSVQSSAPTGSGPIVGEWSGATTCGKKSWDVLLKISRGSSSNYNARLENYSPDALLRSVTTSQMLARQDQRPNAYTFVPAGRGRGSGFTAELIQDGNALTISSSVCERFETVRVTAASPLRKPTTTARDEGRYYSARTIAARCDALLNWVNKIATEYPKLDMRRTVLGKIYPKAVLLYADDDFVPVFGAPYDGTSPQRLEAIWNDLRSGCSKDPFIRQKGNWVWGHTIFKPLRIRQNNYYTGSFSPAAVAHAVRSIRKARHAINDMKTADNTVVDFDQSARSLLEFRDAIKTQTAQLWPSERRLAEQRITDRLTSIARAEADRVLARLNTSSDATTGLSMVNDALATNRFAFLTHLESGQRQRVKGRLLELKRKFGEQIATPLLERAERAPQTLEGARTVATLISQSAGSLSSLDRESQTKYQRALQARRDKIVAAAIENELARLKGFPEGFEGLRLSAAWRKNLEKTFSEFNDTPPFQSARKTFAADRQRRLRLAVDEFGDGLKKLKSGQEVNGASSVQELVRAYLALKDDRSFPISLEYEFLALQN